MALFETVNMTLALSELVIDEADDRWGGVEPYVVPAFYKVDGERYQAILRIANSMRPRPNTTEEMVIGSIQFSVNTLADAVDGVIPVDSIGEPLIVEDNPLTYVPSGNLLGRGEFDSGDTVDVSDIAFTTNLIPIPLRIDVLGLPNATIIDALQGALVTVAEVQGALNTVYLSLNNLIADLFGLDEELETCPVGDGGSSDFFNQIEAQFNCLIPGTVGGVFLCMENDEFGESLARKVRSSLKDEVEAVLNNTINAIALTNPIPDPDLYTDPDAIADNVGSDLTWPVVANIGLSLGAIVLGLLARNPFVAVYGVISSLGWAIGGPDDPISQATFVVDHTMLSDPAALSFEVPIVGDGNKWRLRGAATVHA